jgi:hypothetical protein
MTNFFEKAKADIKNRFGTQPDTPAPTVVAATPAKQTYVPAHVGQWAGNMAAPPVTGLPPGWVPLSDDLPADFTKVWGYEGPLQHKEIVPAATRAEEDIIFTELRQEVAQRVAVDRLYDPEFGTHNYRQEFIDNSRALKEYKQSNQYRAAHPEEFKASLYGSEIVDPGGDYRITWSDSDSFVRVYGVNAGGYATIIPFDDLAEFIADLQRVLRSTGGKAGVFAGLDYNGAKRVAAEYAFQAAVAQGRIELVGTKGDSRTLTEAQWKDKLHGR